MRGTVTIIFNARQSLDIDTDTEAANPGAPQPRTWFDQAWERLGCEPLRPSGKVLLLDKILGVADAYGYGQLAANKELADEFARNALLAVDASRVTVDLPGLSVGF
jgi:hypothetical protein